jgi:hypothetical protein
MKSHVFIIGDIHGCFEEFQKLEDKIFEYSLIHDIDPIIVSVGDLVDRGPQSFEVVDYFQKNSKSGKYFCVMGNHEALFIENLFLNNPSWAESQGVKLPHYFFTKEEMKTMWRNIGSFEEMKDLWLTQGGRETLISYGCNPRKPETWEIPKEHLQYLCSLPLTLNHDGSLITHALPRKEGLRLLKKKKLVPSEKELVQSLFWNRNSKLTKAIQGITLVSGHTPVTKVKKFPSKKIVMIDTYCYNGQKLTAFSPSLNKILSVKAKELYWKR